jgi:RNA recognition motif-containing protein
MSKRLFVGGLPYEMTDEKLQELFSQCGRVEKVKVMFDRATGRSKGFGFIEMATDLEGNAAILKFDGSTLGTRNISVKEAKPAEDRKREGGSNGRPNDNRPRENRPSSGSGENRGGGGFGDQRGPRNGGFAKPAGSGGFGGSNSRGGFSKPGGSGGPGGSSGRGSYGRPGGGQGQSRGDKGTSSDWRSELGFGNNQRKDFRRTNREHNRDQGSRNRSDDFGNR